MLRGGFDGSMGTLRKERETALEDLNFVERKEETENLVL